MRRFLVFWRRAAGYIAVFAADLSHYGGNLTEPSPKPRKRRTKQSKAASPDAQERLNCSDCARRIGITQPALWKALRKHADDPDCPKPDAEGLYDAREVAAWHNRRKVAALAPQSLKDQALAEDVRIKRAKANLAEGKAIPTEAAEELFMRLYTACWECIARNAERYGTDSEKAIADARADFGRLRERIASLSAVD